MIYTPPDTVPLQVGQSEFNFQFIDSKWVKKQIRRSKRNTAVDQWGWDSKEIWRDIIRDDALLHLVPKHWILHIAANCIPPTDHFEGGRLVALSKRPKTGIRPINVTDSWRRITDKGLLQNCLHEYEQFFQQSHPRVFHFATAIPDGVSINGLSCSTF